MAKKLFAISGVHCSRLFLCHVVSLFISVFYSDSDYFAEDAVHDN
jgi:hypothetical protein